MSAPCRRVQASATSRSGPEARGGKRTDEGGMPCQIPLIATWNIRLLRILGKSGLLATEPVLGTGPLNRDVVSFQRLRSCKRAIK